MYKKDKALLVAATTKSLVEDMVIRHVARRKLERKEARVEVENELKKLKRKTTKMGVEEENRQEEVEEIRRKVSERSKLEADLVASPETLADRVFKHNKKSRFAINNFDHRLEFLVKEVEQMREDMKCINGLEEEIKHLKEENAYIREEVKLVREELNTKYVTDNFTQFEDGMSHLKEDNASLRQEMKLLREEF